MIGIYKWHLERSDQILQSTHNEVTSGPLQVPLESIILPYYKVMHV